MEFNATGEETSRQRQMRITKMHYRMFFPDELENYAIFKETNPFTNIDLHRG